MPPQPASSNQSRQFLVWGLALVALVAASTWTALGNQWVQDDLFIILSNKAVHTLAAPWTFFHTPYWPEPFPPDLYRPVTMLLFAWQWTIGDGAPVVFRITSILLYLGTTLACWALARRLLPPVAAWCTAALFAVHPVHVEAVAVAVNQAELIVALVLMVAVTKWIDRRRAGLPVDGWWGLGLMLSWFAAILVKEHAVVLPLLIVAAECTVLRRPEIPRPLRKTWLRFTVATGVVLATVLVLRTNALPDAKGSFTAEGLQGLGIGGRALTMLGVVPEWLRLLAWPHRLKADYSVQEIVAATSFAGPQLLGTALLLLAVALIIATWRTRPVVAFGILWLGISLGPVHNVLVATGIVLAERTLFLGSAGFLLGVAALGHATWEALPERRRSLELLSAGTVALLLILGVSRSSSRQRVWYDLPTFAHQLLIDAPLSYRAHYTYAQVLYKADFRGAAEQHFRRSIELFPTSWVVRAELGDHYRTGGHCWPAADQYLLVLELNPHHTAARGSLVACLMYLGRYAEAADVARAGIPFGREVVNLTRYAALADSALAAKAPRGTVRLPPPIRADSTPP